MTFGGTYEVLPAEAGFLGTKVGGQLALDLGQDIPVCKQCGSQMVFLLQFTWAATDPNAYRGAVVFMCRGGTALQPIPCETGDPGLGANRVLLLKKLKPVQPAGDQFTRGWRTRWTQCEEVHQDPWGADLIDSDLLAADRENQDFINRFGYTKLGGAPLWLIKPEIPTCPACGGRTVFAAQFNSAMIGRHGERYTVPFGKTGVGYLFLCAQQCSGEGGAFLWQSL